MINKSNSDNFNKIKHYNYLQGYISSVNYKWNIKALNFNIVKILIANAIFIKILTMLMNIFKKYFINTKSNFFLLFKYKCIFV